MHLPAALKTFNYLGVVQGLIIAQLTGVFWNSILFGKYWAGLVITVRGHLPLLDHTSPGFGVLVNLLIIICLAIVLKKIAVKTAFEGFKWAFVCAIFVGVTVVMRSVYTADIFALPTWQLWAIEAGGPMIYMMITGALIGLSNRE